MSRCLLWDSERQRERRETEKREKKQKKLMFLRHTVSSPSSHRLCKSLCRRRCRGILPLLTHLHRVRDRLFKVGEVSAVDIKAQDALRAEADGCAKREQEAEDTAAQERRGPHCPSWEGLFWKTSGTAGGKRAGGKVEEEMAVGLASRSPSSPSLDRRTDP